jgi:hypothetical protein
MQWVCLRQHKAAQSSTKPVFVCSTEPFGPSELYNLQRDAKEIESLRMSVFRTFSDPELFRLCETNFVAALNRSAEEDTDVFFQLQRNDVTHIKYDA